MSDIVRLSVNLAPTVANALKGYAASRGITVTEAVRHAVAVLYLVSSEQAVGSKVILRRGDSEREVILL